MLTFNVYLNQLAANEHFWKAHFNTFSFCVCVANYSVEDY